MERLKVLADQTRFNLLKLIINNDLCVGALATRLDISKAAASQHLQALRKAGFVRGEKRGYYTHYSVDKEVLRSLASQLVEMIDNGPSRGLTCFKALPENHDKKGRKVTKMCCNDCCQQPENLKGTPRNTRLSKSKNATVTPKSILAKRKRSNSIDFFSPPSLLFFKSSGAVPGW